MRHASRILQAHAACVLLAAAGVRSESVQSNSGSESEQIGTSSVEEASGAFDVGDQASSGEAGVKCYAGLIGRCHGCDSEGSCLCAKWYNGHSDYVPMDRSRWGQPIWFCPNQEIIIYILLSVVAALTTETIWCALRAARFQHGVVKQNRLQWQQYPPLLCCYATLLAMAAQLTFVVLKLADPTQLIGINLLPSVLHAVRSGAVFAEIALDGVYYVGVQLRAQERSIGRQRIQDILRDQLQSVPKQVLAATAASMISVLGAVLTMLGYIESVELHVMMMLTTVFMENLSGSYFVLRAYIAAPKLLASFDRCIEAVKASYVVASGGASRLATNEHASPQSQYSGSNAMTHYISSLLEEESELKTARASFKMVIRQLVITRIGITISAVVFLATPPLWSSMTYCWLLHSIFVIIAQRQAIRAHLRADHGVAKETHVRDHSSKREGQRIVQHV